MKTLIDSPRTHISVRVLALVMCLMMAMSTMMLGTSTVAYCADENTNKNTNENIAVTPSTEAAANTIADSVEEMAGWVYVSMRAIATPITIIVFAYAGFQFLVGGASGTEKARKAVFAGIGGLALVAFAPVLGNAVAGWLVNSFDGDLGNYNPLK
jgi:predicted cobalt transporter CbtA